MSLFEKQKFKNKDKVSQLKDDFVHNRIGFNDFPKDVLVELLQLTVERIDEKENGGEFDEWDWKDCLCDKEFIVDELFEELEEKIKCDVYE